MLLRKVALLGGALLISACEGIGDGNTVRSMELVPSSSGRLTQPFEEGDVYPLYQCLRDEVSLLGTFDSGQRVQFNSRASWKSSDESVVLVSDRDINIVGISDGTFTEITTQPFAGGTLIPVGEVGEEAVITGSFAGLSASITVRIAKPKLKIVPLPYLNDAHPFDFTGPVYLGEGTRQRLALVANFAGRLSTSIGGGVLNSSINPILWKFTNGEFEADDDEMISDYDKWSVPDAATRRADIGVGGTIRGRGAGAATYPAEAQLSLCPDATDPDLKPTANVRVLPFDTTTPITIDYEPNLHAEGSFAPPSQFGTEDLVEGTAQLVSVIGHLDVDGDGIGDVEQDLVTQAAFDVNPRDAGCDDLGLNCLSNSLVAVNFGSGLVSALLNTADRLNDGYDLVCLTDPENADCVAETDPDLDPVTVQACVPACDPRLASLSATVNGSVATLTAEVFGLDGTPTFLFDCDDGSGVQNLGETATIDCDYGGEAGPFTPTVRVLDDGHAATSNAGAVQLQLGAVTADNTPPTAELSVSPDGGAAPLGVVFSATGSRDPDEGDSLTVYEFEPEPGVIIRQSSPQLTWLYRSQPAAEPSLTVYDQDGVASETVTVEMTVETTAGEPRRTAPMTVRGVPALPCAIETVPPDPASETAFTFPGTAFQIVASFIAEPEAEVDEETDPCDTEPLIGTQLANRFVSIAVRAEPEDEDDELGPISEYVTIRTVPSDYQRVGQTIWFQSPDEAETVSVITTPNSTSIFGGLEEAEAVDFTVLPCDPEQCTP